MILQILYKYNRNISRIKGLIWKYLLFSKKISIGKSLELSSFPKLTLLGKYRLKIGDNVILGKNLDLRIYENSSLIIEDKCKIDDGVRIIAANGSTVHIKRNSKIGFYSVINGGASVEIGPDSSTYGFVYIQSSSHLSKKDGGYEKSQYTHFKVSIGKNVLIGPHSVVLPGSKIPSNTIVKAHTIKEKK